MSALSSIAIHFFESYGCCQSRPLRLKNFVTKTTPHVQNHHRNDNRVFYPYFHGRQGPAFADRPAQGPNRAAQRVWHAGDPWQPARLPHLATRAAQFQLPFFPDHLPGLRTGCAGLGRRRLDDQQRRRHTVKCTRSLGRVGVGQQARQQHRSQPC